MEGLIFIGLDINFYSSSIIISNLHFDGGGTIRGHGRARLRQSAVLPPSSFRLRFVASGRTGYRILCAFYN